MKGFPLAAIMEVAPQAGFPSHKSTLIARLQAAGARYEKGRVVALAHAVEKFWAIAVEAEVLARAIARLPAETEIERALRDAAIGRQTETILALMAALRGDTEKETTDECA